MTPDANSPKTTPPTPARNPIARPGDCDATPHIHPTTPPAKSNPPAARPPMVAVPRPILPVAVPAPAKLT
jgi:hypothetical protein